MVTRGCFSGKHTEHCGSFAAISEVRLFSSVMWEYSLKCSSFIMNACRVWQGTPASFHNIQRSIHPSYQATCRSFWRIDFSLQGWQQLTPQSESILLCSILLFKPYLCCLVAVLQSADLAADTVHRLLQITVWIIHSPTAYVIWIRNTPFIQKKKADLLMHEAEHAHTQTETLNKKKGNPDFPLTQDQDHISIKARQRRRQILQWWNWHPPSLWVSSPPRLTGVSRKWRECMCVGWVECSIKVQPFSIHAWQGDLSHLSVIVLPGTCRLSLQCLALIFGPPFRKQHILQEASFLKRYCMEEMVVYSFLEKWKYHLLCEPL